MKSYSVQTIDRAMGILEYLGKASGDVPLIDITKSLGLDKATTLRLLSSLCDWQLAARDPHTRRYRLGPRLYELGLCFANQWDVGSVAVPVLQRLRDVCQETVGLWVRSGDSLVCLQQHQGLQEVRRTLNVGHSMPLQVGSPGKVFLSHMPPSEARSYVSAFHPVHFVSGKWSSVDGVIKELAITAGRGYAVAVEEFVPNAASIACPVFDSAGRVTAAATVHTIAARWSTGREQKLARILQQAALDISIALGYSPDGSKPAPKDHPP